MREKIQTEHLVLKPFLPQDDEALAALLGNDEIKKTFMLPDLADPAAMAGMVRRLNALSLAKEHFVRGIYLSDRLIGFVNDVEKEDGLIELGYVIHPAFWNRGYATEMLRAVIGELLAAGFTTVRTGAFSENAASLRVMEKCGMKRTPRLETIAYRGENHLCVYYEAETALALRPARRAEACEIYALYQSVLGREFCVWNDRYPGREEIEQDLASETLFVLCETGTIVGALSIVPENELDDELSWVCRAGAREIARVVVAPHRQGRGLAGFMVERILPILQERGASAVHLSVAKGNLPAYRTYCRAGFVTVGEAERYGGRYYLMEKIIDHPRQEHAMRLNPEPFARIVDGKKTIELRLLDEKRQKLCVGDVIVFSQAESGEVIRAEIVALHRFASFEELYAALPLDKCGYTAETIGAARATDMQVYYAPEEEARYGVVGIEIRVLGSTEEI